MLRQATTSGGFGAVLARGDPTAGAILLLHRMRDGGVSAWSRRSDGLWTLSAEADAVDAYVERQRRYDPDLWVIELEVADIHPFTAFTNAKG